MFSHLLENSPSKRAMSSSAVASPSVLTDTSTDTDAPDSACSPDNLFSEFRRLCGQLEVEPSYNAKTKIVADFIKHGITGGTQLQCT